MNMGNDERLDAFVKVLKDETSLKILYFIHMMEVQEKAKK